jgi:hypothetical protein
MDTFVRQLMRFRIILVVSVIQTMQAFVRCAIECAIGNVDGVESSCVQPWAGSGMEHSVLSLTTRRDFLVSLALTGLKCREKASDRRENCLQYKGN